MGKCSTHVESSHWWCRLLSTMRLKEKRLRTQNWISKWKQLLVKRERGSSFLRSIGLLASRDTLIFSYIWADRKAPSGHDHRGVISTMERFTAILIRNYRAFPTWKHPHQVTLSSLSIRRKTRGYAWEVAKKLRDRGVPCADNEPNTMKMQFKIRASQTQRIIRNYSRWWQGNGREQAVNVLAVMVKKTREICR